MTILLIPPATTPIVSAAAMPRTAPSAAPGKPTIYSKIRCATTVLPVTTLRQAVRIALDRTRRMTLLGSIPILSTLALPWLLPVHLLIVGLTADHIRHTPDASLSYCDGRPPRPHAPSTVIAVLLIAGWPAALWEAASMLSSHGRAVVVVLVLIPPMLEMLGLLEFAVLNPQWLTLRRERHRRSDGRPAFVLTSLVSRRDGCGAARRLMDLTYPHWQAADAVVLGYPASKSLVSYYVRMGARRHVGAAGGRSTGRCVTFDCRRPLRMR